MADDQKDIKLISRNNSGFPDWLDFDKLRTEGIDYIGTLSGKIWTDHNVHDPGITTLETLCYALLDLGYRTNLPAKDILARDPNDKNPDDNFFTPTEILTVNPLTILDFRKLLIDIPGIRNAWLEVATDQHANDICSNNNQSVPARTNTANANQSAVEDPCCIDYLNGLYHVYVDTERDLNDPVSIKNNDKKCLTEKIKRALMAHRNICEDFVDLTFLCKWKIGVCAEIELEDNADPEKVYLEMIGALRQFFSPSPRFYTLGQMLEKNKTVDEIFAGRPYDIKESHGFTDSEELENIELKKSIHVSDVYNVLFSVKGIRKVTRLRLINCKDTTLRLDEWIVKVPEGNVPDFNITCSGFAFNRRGIPVSFDFRKYDTLLEINFEHNGKVLYPFPSDKLDAEIPQGFFHKDLGIYSSIQNEFPRVYGIAEGGLPNNVPQARKAQALQFKGYLLFFDQLLANYLAQLQHIRSLFPLRTASGNGDKKSATYFSSLPGNVPDFQQLVRYKIDDSVSESTGETGFLAFPVSRNYFEALSDQQKETVTIDELAYYTFSTSAEKNIAVAQLQDDMLNEACEFRYITKQDECVYYYVVSSSEDFVLVSRKYYKDEESAAVAAASVKYAGTIRSNYRSSIVGANEGYSFSVELNIAGYAGFLQQLTEDSILYNQRRQAFLDHLLARFAEKFTDYALLSHPFYSADDLQARDAQAKSSYLSNYPLVSSTRGKAFDYTMDGWHTDNNSGYEKRFRGLLGHDVLKRKTLCNFEVYDYGQKFVFQLRLSSAALIRTRDKFNTKEEAGAAARELFGALGLRSNYHASTVPYSDRGRILVDYDQGKQAEFDVVYPSVGDAEKGADYFHKMIAMPPANGQVVERDYRHTVSLHNIDDQQVRKFANTYTSEALSLTGGQKALNRINDPADWGPAEKNIGKLLVNPQKTERTWLIDETLFKFHPDDTTIGSPGLFKYELLDKENHFLFHSIGAFASEKKAREAYVQAIKLLTNKNNLQTQKIEDEKKWGLFITDGENLIARCSVVTETEAEAQQLKEDIWKIIAPFVYYFQPEAVPYTWKFQYKLGYEAGKTAVMESSQVFHSKQEADSALADFCNTIRSAQVRKSGNEWQVESDNADPIVLGHFPSAGEEEMKTASQWLEMQKEISRIKDTQQDEETFASTVDVHEDSKCHYAYHLVDKDGLYAIHKNSYADKNATSLDLPKVVGATSLLLDFLELQMSGNIAEYIVPGNNTKWYHYQLKSFNSIPKPSGGQAQKLLLFESMQGYPTKEEAEKAFAENYIEILMLACDEDNYGEGKPISETEMFNRDLDSCCNNQVSCNDRDTIVYIPLETLNFLGSYPQQAVTELIKIVLTYPVRGIKKVQDEDDFRKRFLRCDPVESEECKTKRDKIPCYTGKEKPVYYFALHDKQVEPDIWQSVNYYDTAAQAMKNFRFFIFLLKYQMNYTAVQDCEGGYRIYIREVLAESWSKYFTEKIAWGAHGVQKFIGISEQSCSFHAYTDEDCCFRFFVACDNIRVFHPCKYDSPVTRDKAIKQLQHFLPTVQKWNFGFCNQPWTEVLQDFERNDICRIEVKGTWERSDLFNEYLDLFSLIGNYPLCINDKEGLINLDTKNELQVNFFLLPGTAVQDLKELREKLLWLACYFPFVKKWGKNDAVTYCIEIRLPGFNICERCDDSGSELCPVAWMSACCFNTCSDALKAYELMVTWLKNFHFYKPVFDCPCASYGIELYDDTPECLDDPSQTNPSWIALPKIIAFSPQCYPSAETVCEAIERAKKLINSEGLHLVEHILLRPRCVEDCKCIIPPCPPSDEEDSLDKCKFPYWVVDDDDPCTTTEAVCFRPGQDPYSFIATVALPAWPEKFRNPDNQVLLENILYRETPAHVALRILWLTPHDMCCFESRFKQWLMWTAYRNTRKDASVPCELVNFLFDREFECLSKEIPCEPCNRDNATTETCVEKMIKEEQMSLMQADQCGSLTWYKQLNELFCWPGRNCNQDFYIECNPSQEPPRGDTSIPRQVYVQENAPPPPAPVVEKKQTKAQFVNGRGTVRKRRVEVIIENSAEKEPAEKAKGFLYAGTPTAASFNKLITELASTPETGRKAPVKQQLPIRSELISMVVHTYLDKMVSAERFQNLGDAEPSVQLLRKMGYDLKEIYGAWQPERMAEHIAPDRLAEVERLFNV